MSVEGRTIFEAPRLYAVGGRDAQRAAPPPVAILLSVYNGEAFLNQQLDSFLAQTDANWCLYWRDDGSQDASRAIMLSFQEHRGLGRCVEIEAEPGNLGVACSYALLLAAAPQDALIAFADQDDVWVPQKLVWAREKLAGLTGPALYCARQFLTDEKLQVFGPSLPLRRIPDFYSALIQNIATGHTVMLNAEAAALIRSVHAPKGVLHDWWSYVLVLGAGGQIVFDDRCVSFYRQHRRNAVGVERSLFARGMRALRRGPKAFMALLVALVVRLQDPDCAEALKPEAGVFLSRLQTVLGGGFGTRLRFLLTERSFIRQRPAETWLFRFWFLFYGSVRLKS
ncbi:glycosyl transferase [Asaia siamensis]|uniref:Glycosyl transferase n=1 Tax=Asaia siamensis TaxID=110479 RepID=A0ABQ1MD46_9PROT|nr:glycosyltransferase [Asaia siamensis NRIC 0323]GGC38164.1 glycosyl transferase [Asaia siamensis]